MCLFIYLSLSLLTLIPTAAVSSLAKFGASCEDLTSSILVLLERCLLDNDDEVRDRALLYHEVLKQKQKALSSAYILNRESLSLSLSLSLSHTHTHTHSLIANSTLYSSSLYMFENTFPSTERVSSWSGESSDAVL